MLLSSRKCGLVILAFLTILAVSGALQAGAPTTINDFHLPGSQPLQSGIIETSSGCNCHSNYDENHEPEFTWRGSMMAYAERDPLFLATRAIANQDAPESGDLCIRCHSPKGWLEGRSTPTDGSALTTDDRESIVCHFCHKMVKPTEPGVNPCPGDAVYTANTYAADQVYISSMTDTTSVSGNGYYIVDSLDFRRGPYSDASPPHEWYYSPFHRDAAMCGTCHDVSNPVFTKDVNGKYQPNAFDTPPPDSDPYSMFPVERTFSEWKMSAYNSSTGVFAPQFGGNQDTVRTCQDCHMRQLTGKAAKGGQAVTRDDLGIHDLTGGNTFVPLILNDAFPSEPLTADQLAALDSGIVRARYMLQNAASMDLSSSVNGATHTLDVKITNETGHKLPSGYPEGRSIWINVKAFNSSDQLIYESGAYDTATAILTHDTDLKQYHIEPGISQSLAPIVGETAGPSFHFVLNDTVYLDNRIPPRGFTNANFTTIQSPPVDYSYPDGQYWDNTLYTIPGGAAKAVVTLYYQTTSKEYVEFLQSENVTDDWGDSLYAFWQRNGKSLPEVMVRDSVDLTPISAPNQIPVLTAIGPQSAPENTLLEFTVSATDPDGPAPTLSTSALPGTAVFVDSGNGLGSFSWTPTFADSGNYVVTFYATDDSAAQDFEDVTIRVDQVNRAPVLTAIGAQGAPETTLLEFTVSASDPDGFVPALTTSSLPGAASFVDSGNGTGLFSWTPTYDDSGSYAVTFYATDDSAVQDNEVVTITIAQVNRAPVLAGIGLQSGAENALFEFTINASDPDGITPTLSTSELPGSATFDDAGNGTGLFSWTPSFDDAGSYDVTFYATDDSAKVDSETVTLTVENVNRAPTVSSPVSAEGVVDEELVFLVTGADPDGGIPELSATSAPTGAVFTDSLNGVGSFVWTPALADIGAHEVIFTAFDGDLQTFDTTVITVTDVGSCCDVPGDFNNDGSYNIGDVTAGIAYIFSGGPAPPCPAEADFNADGAYNIGDVTAGIAFIFSGGPSPECGP